jgi:ATP-binding cassette subfamily B protein
MRGRKVRRALLAPEVVQTSAMDCGPASLKSLLEGYGISVSYGRLREACQTDVDGSSIDTMEEIALQLGLDAEQVMVPVDHLLLAESKSLPGIVVTRQPNGFTHFVVVWRMHGSLVQIMDPAVGRRWRTRRRFIEELYIHSMPVPMEAWRDYAGGEEFLGGLRARMEWLGAGGEKGKRLIADATSDPGWHSLASLDAAVRMTDAVVRSGALRRGAQPVRLLEGFFEKARSESPEQSSTIPSSYWSVRPAPDDADGAPQLQLQGAVLVRAAGRRADAGEAGEEGPAPLSSELVRALEEPPARPGRQLLDLLRADGFLAPLVVISALFVAASGLIVEALLFRGLFDIGFDLVLPEQRLAAIALFGVILFALLLVDLPVAAALLRFGRRLEGRLRIAFMEKIPRLGDRYFQSRPISDMAERSHSMQMLRLLPDLGGQFLRTLFQFLLTLAGIIWLDPAAAPVAIIGGAVVVSLPLLLMPLLSEQDLRARTHVGALSRFYLDALLGLVAVRTHGAERAVRREHESLLVEWGRASFGLQRTAVLLEGLQSLIGMGLAAWLLFDHLSRTGGSGGVLLLIYWALQLPVLGQVVGLLVRQYPAHRNMTLRLLEPLGSREERRDESEEEMYPISDSDDNEREATESRGISISMQDVAVVASGHTILEGVSLEIEAGSDVAIVGHSGAGKSSFAGLLLGWHRPASGEIRIDGEILDEKRLAGLRHETAWVDPAVQIWNRSFFENLCYGGGDNGASPGDAIEGADLHGVLERLPDGLMTSLGESGGLLSGGEGQRVRLGRAMLRRDVRLVIFDEPFRGLDRERRRAMLARARSLWRDATILCITHDVSETIDFERVLVLHDGRIVEDDAPLVLAAREGSHYRILLDADNAVREGAWSSRTWRRMRIDEGRLFESRDREEVNEHDR